MTKIVENEMVLAILQNPREKIWGVVREINASGLYIRGIDINMFDELITAISNSEPFYGVSEQFIPMWRIEKISKDEDAGDIPSMETQFVQRAGLSFVEYQNSSKDLLENYKLTPEIKRP